MKSELSKLKLKRLLLCKTQKEVADAIGVSREYINSLENGRSNLAVKIMTLLTNYYQCDISDLS